MEEARKVEEEYRRAEQARLDKPRNNDQEPKKEESQIPASGNI